MKAADATLQAILNSPNQYVIPVFQRYYSWRRPDWQNLWDDISELRDPDQPSRTHFMGSLVFVPEPSLPNKVPAFQVIDGQQRMTTLSLLLCALRNVAQTQGQETLAGEITDTLLIHPYKKEREFFRVYPRQRDRQQYMNAIAGKGLVDGPIGEALEFFTGQITTMPEAQTEEGLRTYLETLKAQVQFVHITLEGENPYRIFRSLNSTGVDLSEADLIRNFMFMHVPLDQQDAFDDGQWRKLEDRFKTSNDKIDTVTLSAFFRDFLMRNGRYVPPATTFQVFEQTYDHRAFDAPQLVHELSTFADFYDTIRGVVPHPNAAVRSALNMVRQLETSTAYPLILNLMQRQAQGQLDLAELATAINLIASFVLRRFICDDTSRTYGRWFVSACNSLGAQPLAGLRKFLEDKGFPSDERFAARFSQANLYGSKYCWTILESLERATQGKEPASLANASIEHIMPQTLTDTWRADLGPEVDRVHGQWLDTIGNLTLSAYNPDMQNKPFAIKKQWYDSPNTNIRLTRDLAQYHAWTESEIVARGNQLAEIAVTVWKGSAA